MLRSRGSALSPHFTRFFFEGSTTALPVAPSRSARAVTALASRSPVLRAPQRELRSLLRPRASFARVSALFAFHAQPCSSSISSRSLRASRSGFRLQAPARLQPALRCKPKCVQSASTYDFGAGAAGAAGADGTMAPGPPGMPAGLAEASTAALTECPLNCRVKENSPNLCPTMFSVM